MILCLLLASPDGLGLEVLGLGAVVLVVIVVLHGFGLDRIVDRYKTGAQKLRDKGSHPSLATGVFAWAIFLMLVLHIVETIFWAVVVNRSGLISPIRDAIYFCANSYTTLGEADMMLPLSWRELSPIMAISGLFTFGWTTSVMFNIVGDHHEVLEDLRAKRRAKPKHRKQAAAGDAT